MLSKDLTPNPKAVNIIRPSNSNFIFPPQQSLNYSSSTDSSARTFSTASTFKDNLHTLSPMIRQPSIESNPGLSFFCQSTSPAVANNNIVLKNNNIIHHPIQQQQQQQPLFEKKIQSQPQQQAQQQKPQQAPLVISRINLSNFQQQQQQQKQQKGLTVLTDLEDIDDDEGITTLDDEVTETDLKLSPLAKEETSSTNMVRTTSAFKPVVGGFGILNGGGLGSFMLRGNIAATTQQQQQPVVDEARVNRKIKDLEIEKKSLLTLNQTLEIVVKEQSNTISNLQDRLAAIERPLTPGLDISLSKNGIMSSSADIILESSDLERYLEDEDKAFERIRIMLVGLIEQAQSAVSQSKKAIGGRVISDYDFTKNSSTMKRNEANNHGRPRSLVGDKSSSTASSTRNLAIPNHRTATRRISLGSINSSNSNTMSRLSSSPTTISSSNKTISSSPTTSPIPHRRYSIQQRSVSRPSSPALLSKSESNTSIQSATSTRSSKYRIKQRPISQQDTTKQWLN